MEEMTNVIEYKCPCCNAGLIFKGENQKLTCEYCENSFDLETVQAYNESHAPQVEEVHWEDSKNQEWAQEEQAHLQAFQCPSCGGEILCEDTTAASFCPYCDNPTIMPSRLSGGIKPDAVIPFRKSKEDAKTAFLSLCKGKALLPKFFTTEQQLEKITGLYVPFWLYDCEGDFSASYKATRIRMWSDRNYNYTKTDHFLLRREAEAAFTGIPMDGSSKMEDAFMESIEPFDYSQMVDFDMAYLTGYLADKYDVAAEDGESRIKERVNTSLQAEVQASILGYNSAVPTSRQLQIKHSKVKYVLLPIWILNTRYRGKLYTFAMNGQTGKMTGVLPVCPNRTAGWFAGIAAGVSLLAYIAQWLLLQ